MSRRITGIILSGGKATRMGGCDKAFLRIADETIIEKELRALKRIFEDIIIVTNTPDNYSGIKGVKIVNDIVRDRGPVAGLYSGLLASGTLQNFVVACDMPFLNEATMRYMIKLAEGYDIVVPRIDGKYHPLFGIYSKNCVPLLEEALCNGELRLRSIFPKARAKFVTRRELEEFDPRLDTLINTNTKEDLARIAVCR